MANKTKKAKHTSGPWEYDGEYIWADSIHGYVADPNMDDMQGNQKAIDANAKLIAASPAMLEALQYAERVLREGQPTNDTIQCVTHLQAIIYKATQ